MDSGSPPTPTRARRRGRNDFSRAGATKVQRAAPPSRLARPFALGQTNDVWRTALLQGALLTLIVASCARPPAPSATYDRNHDGRIDEWVYRISDSEVKRAFDTNGDGKPDVVKTYEHGQLVQVEQDRNFDGRTDLVKKFDQGKLAQVTRDDNFDGKPESVEIYRHGILAMVEHDPDGCGIADSVDYYENGRLVRTQLRTTKR